MSEPIKGYRTLSAAEIGHINEIKDEGTRLDQIINGLNNEAHYDRRGIAIAKTHLQEGLMAAVRAVARPEGF